MSDLTIPKSSALRKGGNKGKQHERSQILFTFQVLFFKVHFAVKNVSWQPPTPDNNNKIHSTRAVKKINYTVDNSRSLKPRMRMQQIQG